MLGVGFVAGTYVLTDTMNAAFDELFADDDAGIESVVRAEAAFDRTPGGPGGGGGAERQPIPEDAADGRRAVPGVDAARR